MKIYIIIMLLVIGLSGCNTKQTKNIYESESNSNYDTKEYESYVNDDGLFRITLFIEKGPYYHNKHINIFSNIEYIGDGDSVIIWHGHPYFNYTIFDGKDYYSEGIVLQELLSTELKKGETYILPFKKSGGWESDAPDAKFWEDYYNDKELKLPQGEYTLTAYCNFGLSERDFSYENKIEIKFEVN